MDIEWLKTYYRGLGWTEQRVTDFLRETALNEKAKDEDVKRYEFQVSTAKE